MKLKITYQPEEQEQAAKVLAALSGLLPGVRVHKMPQRPRLSTCI